MTIPVAPWLIAMTPGSPGAFTIPTERFFDGNEADRRQWTAYAQLMGYTDVFAFLTTYFKGRLISEWDTMFYRDIAPALFERIVDNLIFSSTPPINARGTSSIARTSIRLGRLFSRSRSTRIRSRSSCSRTVSRAMVTKDGKITADKVQKEANLSAEGAGDKWGVKMAVKTAAKYGTENATTVSSDGTATYNVVLPTNHFKLVPSLLGESAPPAPATPAPAPTPPAMPPR